MVWHCGNNCRDREGDMVLWLTMAMVSWHYVTHLGVPPSRCGRRFTIRWGESRSVVVVLGNPASRLQWASPRACSRWP